MTSKKSPAILLREQGATEEEIRFLVSGGRPERWTGQRIELNAMDSRQFVEWLERKLQACGVEKVVPDYAMLSAAYRRAAFVDQIEKALRDTKPHDIAIPEGLKKRYWLDCGSWRRRFRRGWMSLRGC